MKDKLDKALHTELTVWTSKHARLAFHSHIKSQIERKEKSEWLEDEIEKRDKCMTEEAKKAHKAQNRGAAVFCIFLLLNSHFSAKPVCFAFKVPRSMRFPFI